MKIIHNLGILSINKTTDENAGFLLTNKKGSYCSFFNKPTSRYCGFFYFDAKSMEMYKLIEDIEPEGNGEVNLLKNWFYYAERIRGHSVENFFMPDGLNSLAYELGESGEITLVLDCRKSYDNREWGRHYDISEEDGRIIVKFTKKTDSREDASSGENEFVLFLAIKSDNGKHEILDKWAERHYADDEKRNSPPFKRHVYTGLRLKGKKFVFSASKSRESAAKESLYVFDNLQELKLQGKSHFHGLLGLQGIKKIITGKNIGNEVKVAYVNAANSLNKLAVNNKKHAGILAGLPWFFQLWARDTLVSLKSFSKINKNIAQKILLNYLEMAGNDGRLPNLIGEHNSKSLGSADSIGWLFVRCTHLTEKINRDKETINSIKKSMHWIKGSRMASSEKIKDYIKRCNSLISRKENEYYNLLYDVENALEKSIGNLLKSHTKDNFEFNEMNETWMDTDFAGDGRKGARIELQALRLGMYKLAFEVTQNHKYKILENTLKLKAKGEFWNGKILADGLDDWTIRPNMFIASYAYPELLSQKEWEACFENSLKLLWLDWGGLATIDKNNQLFTEYDTGENNKSYHRGDSWFYLNNLAAIQLNRINKIKFKKYVEKIINASTEDILWKGCIGCASEISSAKELSPTGCFSQAWSNAMYMEMIDEVFG